MSILSTAALRTAAVSVAALAAAGAMVAPANADTKTINDGGKHLTTVSVTNGSRYVTVKADAGTYQPGSAFTFWLDTDAKNAGPENKLAVVANSEGMPLQRVGSFTSKGSTVNCNGMSVYADAFTSKTVKIKIPRSCLKSPKQVRASVRGEFEAKGANVIDWAPGYRQFAGWVAQ